MQYRYRKEHKSKKREQHPNLMQPYPTLIAVIEVTFNSYSTKGSNPQHLGNS